MPFRFLLTGWILVLLGSPPFSHSAVLGVPGQYPGIQAAFNASAAGDTVLVERGTYEEHLQGPGHGFTLMSRFPMSGDSADWLETILDGTDSGTCLILPSTGGDWVRIHGMVIANGHGDDRPGGIFSRDSISLELDNVIMRDNQVNGSSSNASCTTLRLRDYPLNFIARNLVVQNRVQANRTNVDVFAARLLILDSLWIQGEGELSNPGRYVSGDSLWASNILMENYRVANTLYLAGWNRAVVRDVVLRGNQVTRDDMLLIGSVGNTTVRNLQIVDNIQESNFLGDHILNLQGGSIDADSLLIENNVHHRNIILICDQYHDSLYSEVRNLVYRGNRAGDPTRIVQTQGQHIEMARVSLRNSLITGNESYLSDDPDLTVNHGVGGAALHMACSGDGSLLVENVEVSHNRVYDYDDHIAAIEASSVGSVPGNSGRALYINSAAASTIVRDCIFHENRIDNPVPETDENNSIGSTVMIWGSPGREYLIENSSITDNDDGGLRIIGAGSAIVRNCVIRDTKRCGILFGGGHLQVHNCLIQGVVGELYALRVFPSNQSAISAELSSAEPGIFRNVTVLDCHVRNLFVGTTANPLRPQNTFENFVVSGCTYQNLEAPWVNIPQWEQPIIWRNSFLPETPEVGFDNIVFTDPGFDPELGAPWLADNSLCIDAGTEDTATNDIENPDDPGFALWPSQGTLSNDIGYTGGPYAGTLEHLVAVRPPNTESPAALPHGFTLYPAYPNPFNPSTTVSYTLARPMPVELSVYNLLGQQVRTLAFGLQDAGEHSLLFTAGELASGVYLVNLKAGEQTQTQRVLLLK